MHIRFLITTILVSAAFTSFAQNHPSPPQTNQRPVPKGGLGPSQVEHHTVTRTHWHTRQGVRYHVVEDDGSRKGKKHSKHRHSKDE